MVGRLDHQALLPVPERQQLRRGRAAQCRLVGGMCGDFDQRDRRIEVCDGALQRGIVVIQSALDARGDEALAVIYEIILRSGAAGFVSPLCGLAFVHLVASSNSSSSAAAASMESTKPSRAASRRRWLHFAWHAARAIARSPTRSTCVPARGGACSTRRTVLRSFQARWNTSKA